MCRREDKTKDLYVKIDGIVWNLKGEVTDPVLDK